MSTLFLIQLPPDFEFNPDSDEPVVLVPAGMQPEDPENAEPSRWPEEGWGTYRKMTGYGFNEPRRGVNHVLPGLAGPGKHTVTVTTKDGKAVVVKADAYDNTPVLLFLEKATYRMVVTDENGSSVHVQFTSGAARQYKFTFIRAGGGYAINVRF